MTHLTPKKLLPLTPATFHILLSLYNGVKHGYGIKREVEERTDGLIRLGAGTLYEAIQRLDRSGLIAEARPPADAPTENARWRFYRITTYGRRALEAELRRLETDVKHAYSKGLAATQGRT
jgi:DNA-binding PadR family transcriptional regulator